MTSGGGLRRHARLESFLQRHLREEYPRLACYEACVAALPGARPRFAFVVLMAERLIVVDNPPKRILLNLGLETVKRLRVVNEYPAFLSGADRENAQHIQLTFAAAELTNPNGDRRSITPDTRPPSTVSKRLLNIPSRIREVWDSTATPVDDLTRETNSMTSLRMLGSMLRIPMIGTPSVVDMPRSQTALGNYADLATYQARRKKSLHGVDQLNGVLFGSLPSDPVQADELHLHLYVLNRGSPVFRNLIALWNSVLTQATLKMADVEPSKAVSRERRQQRLSDLRRFLLYGQPSDLCKARHLVESVVLDWATTHALNRFFWKDPQLFPKLVDCHRDLLLLAKGSDFGDTIGATMDRLKLGSSLAKLVAALLEDAESPPGRSVHLTAHEAGRTRQLLASLYSTPSLPRSCQKRTLEVVTSHQRLSATDWEVKKEASVIRSVTEVTTSSTTVIYQLLQLSYQGREMTHGLREYGVAWVVRILTEVKTWEEYVARLMALILGASSSSSVGPQHSVRLHEQLFVLHALVAHSPPIELHVRLSYIDDLRYFVLLGHDLSQKIPAEYPIRQSVQNLLESLRRRLLENIPERPRVHHYSTS